MTKPKLQIRADKGIVIHRDGRVDAPSPRQWHAWEKTRECRSITAYTFEFDGKVTIHNDGQFIWLNLN